MTPLGMSPYKIIYGKACHLPLELDHKACWAIKQLNMDMNATAEQRKLQLCELEELRLFSSENERIYKERIKQWHDKQIQQKKLILSQQVLLYTSRLKLLLGKLKSRWSGPFQLIKVYPHRTMELQNKRIVHEFKVNGHIVKHYFGANVNNPKEDLSLKDPAWEIMDGQVEWPKIKRNWEATQ